MTHTCIILGLYIQVHRFSSSECRRLDATRSINSDTKKPQNIRSYEIGKGLCTLSLPQISGKKSNKEPRNVPQPERFPLGSLESRAAARLLLTRWNDNRKWLTFIYSTPKLGQDPSRVSVGPWTRMPGGDLVRGAYIPSAWRILPPSAQNVPDDHVPSCGECGVAFAEEGRHGILVRFAASCLDRHDPSPPPASIYPRTKSASTLSEADFRSARDCLVKMWFYEFEEALAEQLNMNRADLRGFVSGPT